ncbi:MAG: hypothetical protein OK454_09560 [Thaumarchaeota archaeon]|nr:hypothetical protein [Nitrososphaerota archaeon]
MTLSGTGEAETPAGGSVCMRYTVVVVSFRRRAAMLGASGSGVIVCSP